VSEWIIETQDVTKSYLDGRRRLVAVNALTLGIAHSELVALRGPSGSGKTTLLGLMGAMIAPSSGDVRIFGESVVHLRERHRTELRRARIGFVFQELALISEMSLIENVLLPCVPSGGAGRAEKERAAQLLERFGLAGRHRAHASQLSGGERQRGAIVRALMRNPPILLLDEPTAHLDSENAKEVVALLSSLRDEGKTIVCATHDPRLADDPSVDRTITMADGRIV
jgi:putative ABC transport system ATP-binding protein